MRKRVFIFSICLIMFYGFYSCEKDTSESNVSSVEKKLILSRITTYINDTNIRITNYNYEKGKLINVNLYGNREYFYEYDVDGKLLKVLFSIDGVLESYDSLIYVSDNKLSKVVTLNNKMEILRWKLFEYDKSNIYKVSKFNKDSVIYFYTLYLYDLNSNLTKSTSFNISNGNTRMILISNFIYDERNSIYKYLDLPYNEIENVDNIDYNWQPKINNKIQANYKHYSYYFDQVFTEESSKFYEYSFNEYNYPITCTERYDSGESYKRHEIEYIEINE